MRSSSGVTLGLGTGPLGGLFEDVSAQAADDTVDAAWSLGVRFFDTAPLYGSGLAEERLGRALARRPREEYTVSTKVGRVLRPGVAPPEFRGAPPLEPVFDFSADGIRRSLAGSLERLRLDAVDLVLLHDPEKHMEEARSAVETARELAPRIGVGTNCRADRDHLRRARRCGRRPARGPIDAPRPLRGRRTAAALRGARRRARRGRRVQQRCPRRRRDVRLSHCTACRSRASEEARRGLRPPRSPPCRCRDSVPAPTSRRDVDPRRRPDARRRSPRTSVFSITPFPMSCGRSSCRSRSPAVRP